ncbi:hypothetical protein IJ425_02020 [bacterium]|nr:hypothetical protein [bacterium]
MKKLLLLFLNIALCANATTFDFNKEGNPQSNKILKDFISSTSLIDENTKVVSYFNDINEDGKDEIIGIVKSQYFYSLAGYKLFALKNNDSKWEAIKSDVYFDNSQEFEIENKKITCHKTVFYKNKKLKAKVKKNKIATSKSLFDCFKNKKAQDIEEITKFDEGHTQNNFELENFHSQSQKNVEIHYNNLDEKTKHYLNLN